MSQSSDIPLEERPPVPDTAQDAAAGGRDTQFQQRIRSDTSSSRASGSQTLTAADTGTSNCRPAVFNRPEGTKRIRSDSVGMQAAGPPAYTELAGDIALAPPDQHNVPSTRPQNQSAVSSNSPQHAPHSTRDMHVNSQEAVTPLQPATAREQQRSDAATADVFDSAAAVSTGTASAKEASAEIDQQRSPEHGGSNERDIISSSAQKRRLNQACLLCRRKKIRCDSIHPSCSNCQRRGIQCIYPEVRKRGRPPRMYTFADFALPGQPLPPELQSLANVHASAMLPASGVQSQNSGRAGASATAQGWSAGTGVASGSFAQSTGSIGDVNGGSTPGYAQSDYDQSPALPPISIAVGRGGVAHSGHHTMPRGPVDPMLLSTPPLGVDQAVLHLFEFVTPSFPIVHRQTLVRNIRDRSLTLPLWLAIHAVSTRFESQHANRLYPHNHHGQAHSQPLGSAPAGYRPSGSVLGAGYAEKAHAMLVNRVGHRQSRPIWARSERGRASASRDSMHDLGGVDRDMPRRQVIELLQSLILLSIYYAGGWELELAVETHAAAVRIAQRMGVHLIDDPSKLQDASGIFNPAVAQHQRKRAQSRMPAATTSMPGGPSDMENDESALAGSHTADQRNEWIECETLRRLWWSMFILDRMYCMCAGCPRMLHMSSFRVRLPCSDLEWDAVHARPSTASPDTAASATSGSGQQQGLMVRTFREAVMHTSLSEQATAEIAATPSADPDVYRYFAALAGIMDSVMDFGDDIRALATPPLLDGTEILNQIRAEQAASGHGIPAYARHDSTFHGTGHGATGSEARPWATAVWLGPQNASSRFARTTHAGWNSPAVNSVWPPDWRARMRVLKERAAALEAQFTDWYSLMPIAQIARKPYMYSQLPLQDRITYFHQQIAYYGGVIQLQSLVVMAQGLLLPDAVADESTAYGYAASGLGPSALTSSLWRLLMDADLSEGARPPRTVGDTSEPAYTPRRRQFGMHSGWGTRRGYGAGMDDSFRDTLGAEDDQLSVPLDESGNSPEIIREELQRMVHAAWRRCTDAATAMSSAVRRATEVRRVASANPNAPYYDPTFRPQVLPPYRGDVSRDRSSPSNYSDTRATLGGISRFERVPMTGEMRGSSHNLTNMSNPGYPDANLQQHSLDRRGSGANMYQHYQPLPPLSAPPQRHQHTDSPIDPNSDALADSASGAGPIIDDASLFMRFNMFACMSAYTGACIHLHNLKIVPRWEEAIRCYHEAAAKTSEIHTLHVSGVGRMAGPGDVGMAACGPNDSDLGMLPNQQAIGTLPPPLPALPCTSDQAREGVRPLVRILEGMSQYWRVSGYVSRIHSMWRDIEGSELSSAQTLPPPVRPSAHAPLPTAMSATGLPPRPVPMSAQEQWSHAHAPPRSPPYGHMVGSHVSRSHGPQHYPQHHQYPSAPSPIPRLPEQPHGAEPPNAMTHSRQMSATDAAVSYRQMGMPPPRQ
ncbi:hypothetical protein IW148_000344 [Coemansia sp. RSA 1199]|nr:hypothetical protein IW148_000344 [Coemansia sp. RSA 1199]